MANGLDLNDYLINKGHGSYEGKIVVRQWYVDSYCGDFANWRTKILRGFDSYKDAKNFLNRRLGALRHKSRAANVA